MFYPDQSELFVIIYLAVISGGIALTILAGTIIKNNNWKKHLDH